MKPKLRISILLNDKIIYNWQSEIINHLCESDFAYIDSILFVPKLKKNSLRPFASFISDMGRIIYFLHEKVDKWLFSDGNSLIRTLKSEKLPPNIKRIDLSRSDVNLEALFKPLDIVLMFEPAKLENRLMELPKYGVWDLTFSGDHLNVVCLPGYWELVQHSPDLITNLRKLETNNQSRILYQSSQITDYFSIYKNRQNHLKRLKLIALRSVQKVYEKGGVYFSDQLTENKRSNRDMETEVITIPNFYRSVKNLLGHMWFLLKDSCLKLIYSDYWFVLINTQKSNDAFGGHDKFKTIDSPKDRFWADPFVISRNERHYIFVEELLFKTGIGRISYIEVDDNGKVLNTSVALEKEYHMSYPLVFQYEGVDYMIPETKENKTIDLYRCEKFPDQWVFVRTLMTDVYAVDATPYYYEGKWWLFANLDEVDGNSSINDELFLFYSNDLFSGHWVSHPQNPIVSDVKLARPAGKIFEENGKIFRPSQDCSLRYGYALNINRITKLSEFDYEEVLERKIFPDWQPEIKRNHTINSSSKATVVDAFKVRNRFGV